MRTHRTRSMLLALMIVVASGAWSLPAFAENTISTLDPEIQTLIDECDAMLEDMATQRDKAIRTADMVETERDEARGQLQLVLPELRAVRDENFELKRQVENQPLRVTWALVGAGSTAVLAGVVAAFMLL